MLESGMLESGRIESGMLESGTLEMTFNSCFDPEKEKYTRPFHSNEQGTRPFIFGWER